MGERYAWNLSARVVADPDDGQSVRPDGSYLAARLGNWIVSAGYPERWWGPGWQGSLILSTNARPVPSIAVDRDEARPFDVPVLKWLGPWRLSTFMGQLEGDRDFPHTLLFGLRAEIRPVPSLQLAASRTAQWCGDGRPCGMDTFWDLLVGHDNDPDPSKQPGNQLAGLDVRWAWPGARVPVALYAQGIGEDEAGSMPAKYLGLFGAETWGAGATWSWRFSAEYSDTACDFLNSPPLFGCAYTNSIYTTGYRFRSRALGHPADADSESVGFMGLVVNESGTRWSIRVRDMKLNRAGVALGHSVASAPATVHDVDLAHDRQLAWGKLAINVGYADVSTTGTTQVDEGWRGDLALTIALR
jgi:hypothetical protein